jgi:hypothetical protein
MKITIYELLGLVKDGKAPKKIKFLEFKMTFIETAEWGDYEDDNHHKLSDFRLIDCLNDFVEIIEEPKKIEYEQIEELTCNEFDFEKKTINSLIKNQRKLIDEINNLKEK